MDRRGEATEHTEGTDEARRGTSKARCWSSSQSSVGSAAEHEAQTLNDLKAAGLRVGLLINLGRQIQQVRRLIF